MARVRSLLLRVDVRPAGRLSRCSHDKKHAIKKGEPRFVIKAPGVATPEKGYCAGCGREMIAQSEKRLEELGEELDRAESAG